MPMAVVCSPKMSGAVSTLKFQILKKPNHICGTVSGAIVWKQWFANIYVTIVIAHT